MSKYIVEIKPEYEDSFKGLMILGAKDSNLFVDALAVDDIELLNSDYINEHFGELQDEAYQRGLNDAWEAAKKISLMSPDEIEKVFPGAAKYNRYNLGYSGVEAIEKLKAYEEKQKADDDIKVGDEVKAEDGTVAFFVTWMSDCCICGVDEKGRCYSYEPKEICGKTGRHFDIDKILEEMRS